MPLNAASSTGRNAASLARLSAMKRGSAAASAGERRADLLGHARHVGASRASRRPASNIRWYCGSSRISSTSSLEPCARRRRRCRRARADRGRRSAPCRSGTCPAPRRRGDRGGPAADPVARARAPSRRTPALASSIAAASPPGPAPMIPTERGSCPRIRRLPWAGRVARQQAAGTSSSSLLRPLQGLLLTAPG